MANQQVVVVREQTNSMGLAGFILSLLGFFTCGLLSPIGLILSIIGMFKPPRGFAVVGMILGIIGSKWLLIALAFGLFTVVLAALGIAANQGAGPGY